MNPRQKSVKRSSLCLCCFRTPRMPSGSCAGTAPGPAGPDSCRPWPDCAGTS
ncbi:hypothetical protein D9X30_0303 [Cupriavidus sp. U2]|nr:hypothetical protein D9X30_0303 [Cupriavidus sp. U2]